jgi:hypothetical protein
MFPAPRLKPLKTAGLLLLAALALPFALYAAGLGLAGLTDPPEGSRLFLPEGAVSNAALAAHMILGGLLTLLVPLQVWHLPRERWPQVHRMSGYVLGSAAGVTGIGGLAYIIGRGTIGGFWMSLGFGLYGMLILLAAAQAIRFARHKDFVRHRRWALRFFVLAMGSWLYRVHYGLWHGITGGAASTPAFDGTFDLVQNFAFYLPYLLLLEIWLRLELRKDQRSRSTQTSL